jgi:hypothetical protein
VEVIDYILKHINSAVQCKEKLIKDGFQEKVYGVKLSDAITELDCVDKNVIFGPGSLTLPTETQIELAIKCKERLETKVKAANPPAPPPQKVSITESDTWAHNEAIGKSNICMNVKTTPPQASISASVGGPGNYKANLPKTPLHPDGTRQVGATITQAGAYTDTLRVYDKSGKQTATTTKTFTVAPPPQDGPTPVFGPPCPEPTK